MTTTQNPGTALSAQADRTDLPAPSGRTVPITTAALAALALTLTACTGPSDSASPTDVRPTGEQNAEELPKVLLLGDSVAQDIALPMEAAFEASGVEFESLASEGGGNVVGPFSEERWETLPEEISAAEPGLVIYQITSYDWGTEQEQREGYGKLLETVAGADAELVFVTMPPIEPDEFYEPHMADLARAPEVARSVAEDSDDRAEVLDAGEVWGDDYQEVKDGEPDRNPDGVHVCPQGGARLTHWMLDQLGARLPGFAPAAPEEWADTGWSSEDRFGAC